MNTTRESLPWIGLSILVTGILVALLGLVRGESWSGAIHQLAPSGNAGVVLTNIQTRDRVAGLRGELALKDPTPLFLPTKWNSGQVEDGMDAELTLGASFGEIGPELIFPDAANTIAIPDGVEVPSTALSTVERIDQSMGHGELTRRERNPQRLGDRLGYAEVLTIDSSKVIHQRVLTQGMVPYAVKDPVEAVLAVNAAGVWVRPTVIEAAEGASVDFEEINSVLKALHLESILGPGIYRILLGP